MKRRQPSIDELIQTEQREAAVALRCLAGESIAHEPLWFRGSDGTLLLTYAGALDLAECLGIERINSTVTSAAQRNGTPVTYATCTVRFNGSTRIGAAVSKHVAVAVELSFRNAVKQTINGTV